MKSQEQKEEYDRKANEIEDLLSDPDEVDLWALRELCFTEGGLINDSIRKKAWPKLVGLSNTLKDPPPLPPLYPPKAKGGRLPPTSKSSRPKSKSITAVTTTPSPTTSQPTPASVKVVDPTSVPSFKNQIMASCIDANQIALDIARCTWHLLNGSQRTRRNAMRNKHKKRVKALLKRKQKRLGNFINLTLIRSYGSNNTHNLNGASSSTANDVLDMMDKLRYYQGYHDVSCVLMSALGGETRVPPQQACIDAANAETVHEKAIKTAQAMGLDLPSEVLVQLSQSHFRDMMKNNFENLTKALKLVVMPLLAALDREVYQHLVDCDMEPYFCLSWIITWFSHDVRDTDLVKRLFDFFIASHPLMSIYVSVAMILHPYNRMEVLDADCDFACVHKALADLPRNSCNVGWKFVGNVMGGGYVSGDDEETDGVSLEGSLLSQEVYREDCAGSFEERSTASTVPSMSSDSFLSSGESCRVPFQELIDLAIVFMRRIPPRTLMRLAHRHYDSKTIQELASDADSITMLQSPPAWAVASTIESDKAIKRRTREMKSRKKNKGDNVETKGQEMDPQERKGTTGILVEETRYPHAVIAAGIGPDGDGDILRRKRKRKLLRTGAIVMGVLAILCGLVEREILTIPLIFRDNRIVTKADDSVSSMSLKIASGTDDSKVFQCKKSLLKSDSMVVSKSSNTPEQKETHNDHYKLKEDIDDQRGSDVSVSNDIVDKDEEYNKDYSSSSSDGSSASGSLLTNYKAVEKIDSDLNKPRKEEETVSPQNGFKKEIELPPKSVTKVTWEKLELVTTEAPEFYPMETGSINYIFNYIESLFTGVKSLELRIEESRKELEAIATRSSELIMREGKSTNVFLNKPVKFAKKILDEVKIALDPEAEAIVL